MSEPFSRGKGDTVDVDALLAECKAMEQEPAGVPGQPDTSWPVREPPGGVIFPEDDEPVYRKVAANLHVHLTPAHRAALAKIKKQAKR